MANPGENSRGNHTQSGSSRVMQDRWWLDHGEESCEHCLQRYAYEIEVRCVACDAPLCPQCAVEVRATRTVYCPGCEEE